MPIELQYRDGGEGVVFVCTGIVTASDFYKANEEIYAEERVDLLRYQLIDFNAAARLDASSEAARRHAEMDKKAAARKSGIVIAVVEPDDLFFGLSRMW